MLLGSLQSTLGRRFETGTQASGQSSTGLAQRIEEFTQAGTQRARKTPGGEKELKKWVEACRGHGLVPRGVRAVKHLEVEE